MMIIHQFNEPIHVSSLNDDIYIGSDHISSVTREDKLRHGACEPAFAIVRETLVPTKDGWYITESGYKLGIDLDSDIVKEMTERELEILQYKLLLIKTVAETALRLGQIKD